MRDDPEPQQAHNVWQHMAGVYVKPQILNKLNPFQNLKDTPLHIPLLRGCTTS